MTYIIQIRNVCCALPAGVDYLVSHGVREETRAGPALVAPGPVIMVTEYPQCRVLFSAIRDANPFFHLYEAIWMLGGRDDAAPLNMFVRDFGERYGETGGEVHGAYGRRWRSAFGFDQLDAVVEKLRKNPSDRQCVLQMWDATVEQQIEFGPPDTYYGQDDLRGEWRDRPCNTHIYLSVRREWLSSVLDLGVCCRSNDFIWGLTGANACHFSILQEYLAARIGVGVGMLTQFAWNCHAYLNALEKLGKRVDDVQLVDMGHCLLDDRYGSLNITPLPIFDEPYAIDADVREALAWFDRGARLLWDLPKFSNSWFHTTWAQAIGAHAVYRTGTGSMAAALHMAQMIAAPDWRAACVEWLNRRSKK